MTWTAPAAVLAAAGSLAALLGQGSTPGHAAPSAPPPAPAATTAPSAPTPSTPPAAEPMAVVKGTLTDAAFLEGAWNTTGPQGWTEVLWSAPKGNSMMACLRWIKEGDSPFMVELLSIAEESGTLKLRLRHHTATLESWEDKDAPAELTLAKHASRENNWRMVFAAEKNAGDLKHIVYERSGDSLEMQIVFKDAQPPRPAIVMKLNRATLGK